MSKSLHRLTAKQAANAKAGSTLNDGGGLFLRVGANGNSRWVYRFKLAGKKQREMGLGPFPQTTLAHARRKALEARDHVTFNRDPIEVAESEAEAAREADAAKQAHTITFGQYADEKFLPSVLPTFSNSAHIQQWEATFRTTAASLRDKPLAEVTREDVLAVLQPIWTTKHETAVRSQQRFKRLFSHAIQNGAYSAANPASWDRFNQTLPPKKKLTRGHHPSLPIEEVPAFYQALRSRTDEPTSALMLEWIILSACRTGEARFAVWTEIDLERGVWTIPAKRTKTRRLHLVPITDRMREIALEVRRRGGDTSSPTGYVFPGPKEGKPLSEMACNMLMRRMEHGAYTVHGFRAAFRGWAGRETDFPFDLIEEQLAHQLSTVQRAYMRVATVEKRRPMMEAWHEYLSTGGGSADE